RCPETLRGEQHSRHTLRADRDGCRRFGQEHDRRDIAGRIGWRFEDGDKFHPASNVAKMSAGVPLTDEERWPWLQAVADEIDRLCAAGERAVVACSALRRVYRDVLIHGRNDVRLVYLDGSQQLIADRLNRRKGHFMPPDLLASQFKTLEPPAGD